MILQILHFSSAQLLMRSACGYELWIGKAFERVARGPFEVSSRY